MHSPRLAKTWKKIAKKPVKNYRLWTFCCSLLRSWCLTGAWAMFGFRSLFAGIGDRGSPWKRCEGGELIFKTKTLSRDREPVSTWTVVWDTLAGCGAGWSIFFETFVTDCQGLSVKLIYNQFAPGTDGYRLIMVWHLYHFYWLSLNIIETIRIMWKSAKFTLAIWIRRKCC